MKRILVYLRNHRFFLPFLIVSCVLWYISRLSHDYTTTISINVEIVPDFEGQVWIEQGDIEVEATVKGDGREIMLHQLALTKSISIAASELTFNKVDNTGLYTIDKGSMQKAMQTKSPALGFIEIHDIPQVNISPLQTKTLPIRSNIEIECSPQHMVLGDVELSIDSIVIKAPKIILDTLESIQTKAIRIEDANAPVSGIAKLVLPKYAITQARNIQYKAMVAGYTEIEVNLPIGVKNMPSGITLVRTIPKSTLLRMKLPLINSGKNINPKASIDFNYQSPISGNPKNYPITIDSIPSNAQIINITPQHTIPLFEKI